ncbi:DMP19 family protein, partial [Vibrio vulnificus]|nr:DMP19 family protein [Vibrio vulnificus]
GNATEDDIAAKLEAFENRKIYMNLDIATLQQISDEDVELAVVDYAHAKLSDRYDHEMEVVRGFSLGVRALYLTWTVEAEVNNGGVNQYYFNTEGKFSADAEEHEKLMREANEVHRKEAVEMARFKEIGTIEAFSESYQHTKLGPFDNRFYKLSENLSALRVARIRKNPEMFVAE